MMNQRFEGTPRPNSTKGKEVVFMRIHKAVGLWHVWEKSHSKCGLHYKFITEEMIIGQGRRECQPDPPKKECCLECFPFLK
jgi:hypothetical protein